MPPHNRVSAALQRNRSRPSASTSAVAVLNVSLFGGATLADVGTEIAPMAYDIKQLTGGGNGDGVVDTHDTHLDRGNTAPRVDRDGDGVDDRRER